MTYCLKALFIIYVYLTLLSFKLTGMKTINTYLTFNGNCEEAFNFYKSVFGGEFSHIGHFSNMPEKDKIPKGEENRIMHVSLPMGDTVLMGSDSSEAFGPPAVTGTNFSISIGADSVEEADTVFKALAEGGQIIMPMADTFWNAYYGMLVDRFGIKWMVNFDKPAS